MRGRVWRIIGIAIAVAGAVFTLQGVGILGGSSMTGSTTWAILGPVIVVVGIAIYARSTRES
jgi:hypothetical protein